MLTDKKDRNVRDILSLKKRIARAYGEGDISKNKFDGLNAQADILLKAMENFGKEDEN